MLHSFQLNGYNIVMDVNSGAVHVVDGMVYDMIQLLDADFLARSFDSSFTEKLEQAYQTGYEDTQRLADDLTAFFEQK